MITGIRRSYKSNPIFRYCKKLIPSLWIKTINIMKKRLFIKFSLGLFSFSCSAQKFKTFKDHCGLYHKHMDDLYRQKGSELFYHFRQDKRLPVSGPNAVHWEAAYAASTDSVKFYLEDIDSAYFNQQQAAFAWN